MKLIICCLVIVSFSACSYDLTAPATYQEKFEKREIPQVFEVYNFQTNNQFKYKLFHDDLNSSKYGYGHYQIENRELILNFSSQPMDTLNSAIKIKEINKTDTSFIQLKVHTISSQERNLLGVNVYIQKPAIGATTNQDGYAELKIAKNELPATLVISRLDYQNLKYEVDTDHNLSIKAKLAPQNFGFQIKGEVWKKKIKTGKNIIFIDGKKYAKDP